MSEAKIQAKILKYLESIGWYCIKIMTCNRSGVMDIVGCTDKGLFFGIEVKFDKNKPSELQKYHIEEVTNRNGIAFVAWSLEDVKNELTKRGLI